MKTISNINWIRVTALAAISAVGSTGALAQGPGGDRPPMGGPHGGPHGGPGAGGIGGVLTGMMGAAIDLTDAQRTQIRSILDQSADANKDLFSQLRTLHEQERAAVKANKSEQELRSLAQQSATVMAQANGARLVAEAKVYQVLTPTQREKLDKITSSVRQRPQSFRRPRE